MLYENLTEDILAKTDEFSVSISCIFEILKPVNMEGDIDSYVIDKPVFCSSVSIIEVLKRMSLLTVDS